MYARLFQRRSSKDIFAQLCEGNDVRKVHCTGTEDVSQAMTNLQEMLRSSGRNPEAVPVIIELTRARDSVESIH